MNHQVRAVLALAGVATLMTGCGQGSTPQSHGDTPTPASPGQSVTAAEIDSLVVPMDQVPDETGALRHSSVSDQLSTSLPVDDGGPHPGSPCFLASPGVGDSDVFGHAAVAFRNVRYTGFSNATVVQAIAVYADSVAAREQFRHLADSLNACKAADDMTLVDSVTSAAASWHQHGVSPVSGQDTSTYSAEMRVVKNVLYRVNVSHWDENAPAMVADQIAAKINKPD